MIARFFKGDLGDGGAEEFFVVEVDGGQDGELGVNDIGGIQAAAHAGFKHHDFSPGGAEQDESHAGDRFKVGRVHVDVAVGQEALGGGVDFIESCGEFRGADGLAGDADALGGLGQVGARNRARCGTPERRRAASIIEQVEPLPLVPATWTKRAARSGWAEGGQQALDAFQAELDGFVLVAERIEEADRVRIGRGEQKRLAGAGKGPAIPW